MRKSLTERILPLAAVDRLIRKAGASRVSESAVAELTDLLEEFGIRLSQKASQLASHANRKTVTSDDIKLANKS